MRLLLRLRLLILWLCCVSATTLLSVAVLLALPPNAVALGLCSVPLFSFYPLAKRYTNWPQAVLGLAFNWGALMGSTALHGSCDLPVALPLYAGCWWWTMMYDTIYAHQDRVDDEAAGMGSAALTLGTEGTRKWVPWLYTGAVASWTAAGALAGAGWPMYAGIAAAGVQLAKQIRGLDLDDPGACLRAFRSNVRVGYTLAAGIALNALIL